MQQFKDSYNHNFLELPISYKLTRQSYVDALKELKGIGKQWTEHNSNKVKFPKGSYLERSLSRTTHICSELNDMSLSDKERIEAYRECDAYYDWFYNMKIDPVLLLYTDPEVNGFRCTYKIDNALRHLAVTDADTLSLRCFAATSGCNERQYGSAKFNLPVVQATRTMYSVYSGYHSSSDNQGFFSLDSLIDSALEIFDFVKYYEINSLKPNMSIACEPQLGRRGLYPDGNNPKDRKRRDTDIDLNMMMTILNLASGECTTDEIAHMLDISPLYLSSLLEKLKHKGVIDFTD